MYIVHVFVQVKPEFIEPFMAETMKNAMASCQEPGIARFDVLQEEGNPDRFVLVEVYRTKDDPARHKETQHYQQWRDAVEEMCASPRTKKVYANVFPGEEGWD
jgi:(4S)-4-hydroxy-5-phosphonooxypentane-2,3-dione isomerase